MRNKYTADFGDYIKYALLRQLTVGRKLGIAWYLDPRDPRTNHGYAVDYVYESTIWRHFDSPLFDELQAIVTSGHRAIAKIENSPLFQEITFANNPLPTDGPYTPQRPGRRKAWFERTLAKLTDQEVIYVDPDTGVCENDTFSYGALDRWGHVPMRELERLVSNDQNQKRPTIVYHTPGLSEPQEDLIQPWMRRLDCKLAFHAPGISIRGHRTGRRLFFILNPDEQMEIDLVAFAQKWSAVGHLDEGSP